MGEITIRQPQDELSTASAALDLFLLVLISEQTDGEKDNADYQQKNTQQDHTEFSSMITSEAFSLIM